MYTVYYNLDSNAHTIINTEYLPISEEIEVFKGTLQECKDYLEPLNVIYQTIDVPTFDSSGFSEEDNYIESIPTEAEGLE